MPSILASPLSVELPNSPTNDSLKLSLFTNLSVPNKFLIKQFSRTIIVVYKNVRHYSGHSGQKILK